MHFNHLQTFQASLEASARELVAKQLALVQSFNEKQKNTFANLSAFMATENFTKNQTHVKESVADSQAFIASSLEAVQAFWSKQMPELNIAIPAATNRAKR